MKAPSPRALHCVAALNQQFGGPSRTVPALCDVLAQEIEWVGLASNDLVGATTPVIRPANPRVDLQLVRATYIPGVRALWAPGFSAQLVRLISRNRVSIVHDHGIWHLTNHAVARAAAKSSIPRVVSPRGMLMSWSLGKSRRRKALTMKLFQGRDLDLAAGFVATSDEEARDIRALSLPQPIALIPNGVDVPPSDRYDPPTFMSRRIGVISRLHPKKGLLKLLEAWSRARAIGWKLIIAGPDEVGHRAQLLQRITELNLGSSVELLPEVSEGEKYRLLASFDLVILPSESENFGMIIAEALAVGVPVIASKGTPWGVLMREDCGWWVENEPESLAATLTHVCTLPAQTLASMGQRGRRLVQNEYSWEAAGKLTATFYRWLLNGGPAPPFVV